MPPMQFYLGGTVARVNELGALCVDQPVSAGSTKQRDPQPRFLWRARDALFWICLNRRRDEPFRAGHHISACKKPLAENAVR